MSTRSRPAKPPHPPATRPRRDREGAAQPIPREADVFAWAPGEMLIGEPRADRKASPSKLAKLALEANPEKSNRAIAVETGIALETVRRTRNSGDPSGSPAKIVGLDGKSYPSQGCRSNIGGQTVSQRADDHQ
jgi:hypothetical protein